MSKRSYLQTAKLVQVFLFINFDIVFIVPFQSLLSIPGQIYVFMQVLFVSLAIWLSSCHQSIYSPLLPEKNKMHLHNQLWLDTSKTILHKTITLAKNLQEIFDTFMMHSHSILATLIHYIIWLCILVFRFIPMVCIVIANDENQYHTCLKLYITRFRLKYSF
jgi:hypothetical protein